MNWTETTEERFFDMLGCVPPAAVGGGGTLGADHAFQVGEASNHVGGRPTFATFYRTVDKYYESAQPMTFREFAAEFPGAKYYYE
jgi:hypothetical protein